MAVLRFLNGDAATGRLRFPPATVLSWCGGMLVMALALFIAHWEFELGLPQTMKSFAGWAKGWALLAVFPLIGAMLPIRPIVVVRALSWLSLQTLVLAPVFVFAELAGLPSVLYVSPLHVIASGPEFFDVSVFQLDEVTGKARWRFYSPWATAAAFLASIGFITALFERSQRLKLVGMLSAVVVFLMSGSRLSAVALPLVLVLMIVVSNATSPRAFAILAVVVTIGALLSQELVAAFENATDTFNSARADSSRVRAALGNIAVHRWSTEAPIFGHGVLEPGGHVVQRMMIGSHHTWWGLLFVKGAAGFAALALPFAVTSVALALRAQADRVARAALGILIAMLLFSFADNLEIIAYLMWPALILMGIALRRPIMNPFIGRLGS